MSRHRQKPTNCFDAVAAEVLFHTAESGVRAAVKLDLVKHPDTDLHRGLIVWVKPSYARELGNALLKAADASDEARTQRQWEGMAVEDKEVRCACGKCKASVFDDGGLWLRREPGDSLSFSMVIDEGDTGGCPFCLTQFRLVDGQVTVETLRDRDRRVWVAGALAAFYIGDDDKLPEFQAKGVPEPTDADLDLLEGKVSSTQQSWPS